MEKRDSHKDTKRALPCLWRQSVATGDLIECASGDSSQRPCRAPPSLCLCVRYFSFAPSRLCVRFFRPRGSRQPSTATCFAQWPPYLAGKERGKTEEQRVGT